VVTPPATTAPRIPPPMRAISSRPCQTGLPPPRPHPSPRQPPLRQPHPCRQPRRHCHPRPHPQPIPLPPPCQRPRPSRPAPPAPYRSTPAGPAAPIPQPPRTVRHPLLLPPPPPHPTRPRAPPRCRACEGCAHDRRPTPTPWCVLRDWAPASSQNRAPRRFADPQDGQPTVAKACAAGVFSCARSGGRRCLPCSLRCRNFVQNVSILSPRAYGACELKSCSTFPQPLLHNQR